MGGGGIRGAGGRGVGGGGAVFAVSLSLVDFGVSLALITACKLAPTLSAGERLLASVRADVRGQVVTAAEVAHADATLEWFLTRVHTHVTGQLI